jgi:DNA-binding CsgD family transcriptional regulator
LQGGGGLIFTMNPYLRLGLEVLIRQSHKVSGNSEVFFEFDNQMYLFKGGGYSNESPTDFLTILRMGKCFWSGESMTVAQFQDIFNRSHESGSNTKRKLTRREGDMLSAIILGFSYKYITGIFSVSIKTVSAHKNKALRKLNFNIFDSSLLDSKYADALSYE